MPQPKPNAKIALAIQSWADDLCATAEDWFKPLIDLVKNWQQFRDISKNNYELGLRHLALGHTGDAIFRFKLVVWLDPNHANGWHSLGRAYMAEGKTAQAEKALRRALALKPGDEDTVYMLAIARGAATPVKELPTKIPLALAKTHFDTIAEGFTEEQVEILRYQGHTLLTQAIRAVLTAGRIDHMILELGVGTGLCGPLLRDVAAQIIGIDFSKEMLEQAMQLRDKDDRKIYDALINRELHEFLAQSPGDTYDIVMAASTFSYVGDLQAAFAQSARLLKTGGVFALTADSMAETLEKDGFRFAPASGRFRFARSYLEGLAAANGLKIASFEEGAIYPGYTAWICVFRK